jgi:hypothetical protein
MAAVKAVTPSQILHSAMKTLAPPCRMMMSDFPSPLKVSPGCFSLVLPVELYQEVEAQGFLAQIREGFGAVFHDQRHVLHNGEDVLVDFRGKIELLLGGELEIEWLGSDLLTDREDG